MVHATPTRAIVPAIEARQSAARFGDTAGTMSRENVELVRSGVEDVETFWGLLDEYVVWDLRECSVHDLDGVYVGRDSVVGASRKWWGTWTDYRLDAEEFIDAGSSVVVCVHE